MHREILKLRALMSRWERVGRPAMLVLRGAQLAASGASLALTFGSGPSGFGVTSQVLQACLALLAFVAALTVERRDDASTRTH